MALMTLTLVQMTALVGSFALQTPADRIGSGNVMRLANYPTTFLSQGQFPLPRLPESEHRSRQEVIEVQAMPTMPPARGPVGLTGSFPGDTVSRRSVATFECAFGAKPPARLATRTVAEFGSVDASRVSVSGLPCNLGFVESDCQSRDEASTQRSRNAKPIAGWHLNTTPDTATKK